MSACGAEVAGFTDRLANACAIAVTSARIAADAMETMIEPRLPQKEREVSEKLRVRMDAENLVSEDIRRKLAHLGAAVDKAIEAETTTVTSVVEGMLLPPGKAPVTRTQRQVSPEGERLRSARRTLDELSARIAAALDLLAAARIARRLLDE